MNTNSKEAYLNRLKLKIAREIGEIARQQGVTENKFKQIPGFEDYYVSEDGVVASTKRDKVKFLSPTLDKKGYEKLGLKKDGKSMTIKVHRLVALTFLKQVDGKDVVNHIDGTKRNNHVTNLEWTNIKGNVRHYHGLARDSINVINDLKEVYKQHKSDPEKFMKFFAKRIMSK